MFDFNNEMGEKVCLDFENEILASMIEFMYTGQTTIESNKLVDLLDLSH